MITCGLRLIATRDIGRSFLGPSRFRSDDPWISFRPIDCFDDVAVAIVTFDAELSRPDANGKLYLDYGDGFVEADAISLKSSGRTIQAIVASPGELKSIRWDPDDRRGEGVRLRSASFRPATDDEQGVLSALGISDADTPATQSRLASAAWRLVQGPGKSLDSTYVRQFTAINGLLSRESPFLDRAWLARFGVVELDVGSLLAATVIADFGSTPLFNAGWYRAQARLSDETHYFDALDHYLRCGESLGLAPNPYFRPDRYLAARPDVREAIRIGSEMSALEHAIRMDGSESRQGVGLFDPVFYKNVYGSNEEREGLRPFTHFVGIGARAGNRPNGVFDAEWYEQHSPDCRQSLEAGRHPDAFSHLVMNDIAGASFVSPFFDPHYYLEVNGDIGDAKRKEDVPKGVRHYILHGWREARTSEPTGLAASLASRLRNGFPNGAARDALLSLQGDNPDTARIGDALWAWGRPDIRLTFGHRATVFAGGATRIYVDGRASWPHARLVDIDVVDAPWIRSTTFFTYPRVDISEIAGRLGGSEADLAAGFLLSLEVDASGLAPGERTVDVVFTFERNGERRTEQGGTVEIVVLRPPVRSTSAEATQVLMATYNPERESFERQVDSILNGSEPVSLVISDDASPGDELANVAAMAQRQGVEAEGNEVNLGFITNFERALMKHSPSATTLLFSDQDDHWYADKVVALRSEMNRSGAVLAYSDMRIVDDGGGVLSPTFWDTRVPHHADPVSLTIANAVTGAASAFSPDLVPFVLPFPRFYEMYHDHWLAVVAAAYGRIAYVDRPLYDYVQHGANVLGFAASRSAEREQWLEAKLRLNRVRRTLARGRLLNDRETATFGEILNNMTVLTLQRYVMLKEALLRIPTWSDPLAREVAEGFCAAIEGQPVDFVGLKKGWRKLKRHAGGDAALLGIDYRMEVVIGAMVLLRHDDGAAFRQIVAQDLQREGSKTAGMARFRALALSDLQWRLAPLPIEKVPAEPSAPIRFNLFLPDLNSGTFFGGYYSMIALAQRMIERGHPVRIIQLEYPVIDYAQVSTIQGAFPELIPALEQAELIAASGRERPIPFTSRDALVATAWWTAHVVDGIRKDLGRERFTYLIQEFEPFTFVLGTFYRAAELSYTLPHDGIYSTAIMRRYFEAERIGQFAPGRDVQEGRDYLTFDNPIVKLTGREAPREASDRKRLLLYARPQAHAARNMYEFSVEALRRAVSILGDELDGWDMVGAGADASDKVPLGSGRELRLLRKLNGYGYRYMLSHSDVGVALMYTPHPSLVPIEMASAGLVTVTNACMTKTPELMATISPDILVPEPEIDAIADAIVVAVRRVNAGDRPRTRIAWPGSPREAFPDGWMDQLVGMMERTLLEVH